MNGTSSGSNIAGVLLSVSNVLVPPCGKRTRAQTIYTQEPRRRMARSITQDRVGLTSDTNGEKRTGGSPTQNREELTLLAGRLIGAQEEERRRISRELHDSLGSDIFVLSTKISLIRDGLSHGIERVNLGLQELQQAVAALGHKIRSISHNLHPAVLEQVGLPAALDALCSECLPEGLRVRRVLPQKPLKLDKKIELCLFRIAQEALRNIIRHTRCRFADLRLKSRARKIVMTIRDRGIGFDLRQKQFGLGLISMQERVSLVLGSLEVQSFPGTGTRIRVTVPLSGSISERSLVPFNLL
jgi:signal transduction histidine kinase